ncbi:MAG: hypothetical protein IT384_27380 [Deltaproteobacteria bacterium]|nr:hypothetical protein [Deltaproteobacteria bacterium]
MTADVVVQGRAHPVHVVCASTLARLSILILLGGCAPATRIPVASAARPLALPAGASRVQLGGTISGGAGTQVGFEVLARYGLGLTDALALHFPLTLAFGGPVSETADLLAYAGVTGLELHAPELEPFSGDPRLARRETSPLMTRLGGGLAAQLHLAESSALLGELSYNVPVTGTWLTVHSIAAKLALKLDLASWLAVAPGLGVITRFGPGLGRAFADLSLGSRLSFGGSLNPLLSVHLGEVFDLLGLLGASVSLESGTTMVEGGVGVEARFQ